MKQKRRFDGVAAAVGFINGLKAASDGNIHTCTSGMDPSPPHADRPYWVEWVDENKREAELPQEPEPMTPQEYVREHKGTRCPVCRSDDITGDTVTVDAGQAFQDIACSECNAAWTDCYELSGYDNLER